MPLRLVLRLVPVAAAAWASALLAVLLPDAAPAVAGALWALTVSGIAAAALRRGRRDRPRLGRASVVVLLALALAAAAASHVVLAQPSRQAVSSLGLAGGRAVDVEASVVGKVERRADGALAFDAVTQRLAVGAEAMDVRVEVIVQVAPEDVEGHRALDVGAIVRARGTAEPSRPGERAVLAVRPTRGVQVLAPPSGAAAVTATLRHSLVAAVTGLPGDGAGLVPGLAVGDTSAVTADLDAAMKESSLSHLTAVSGANCALVVGLAYAAAAAAGGRRSVRVAAGIATLGGFILLVTPEPSVVRAGAMAGVAMLGVLLGRPGAGMAILSLAVAVLLVADPWLAASLGFALSTVATASLLLVARPLAAGLSKALPRALALALSVPLAAQLACGPLLVLIAPQVPVYGILANLIAAPAAPVATVVGLAACLSAPLPVLQQGLAAIAWIPASWIAGTATTMSALPGDLVPWLDGWPGVVALSGVGLAIGLLIALRRGSAATRAARMLSGAVLAVVLGFLVGGGLLSSVAGRWTLPPAWSVLACDVGQGDAVLLRSAGAVALVDTGPAPEPLSACLAKAGIDRVDLLVLTHFDLDHAGGAGALEGRVGTVLHGPPDAHAGLVLDSLRRGGADLVQAAEGLSGSLGDARWRVLWPRPNSRAFAPGNDSSVALDVRGGGIPATLLLGDLSASPQHALTASGVLDPPYAIVKVAHHGSADQDGELYEAAAPRVALFTVGAGNDYGHPRDETIELLERVGARVARTDDEGMLALWQRAGGVEVWRERAG